MPVTHIFRAFSDTQHSNRLLRVVTYQPNDFSAFLVTHRLRVRALAYTLVKTIGGAHPLFGGCGKI